MRDPGHRILALDDVGAWLGLWPASRAANPLSLKWLLERERDLKAELEPIVGEIAASYVSEFDKSLKELLAKSGPLTDAEMATLDKEVLALLQRAGKELGKDAGPVVGDHTAGVYTKIRELVGKKIGFNRIDKAAVAWMGKDPHYWIQDYFGKAVSAKLQAIGQSALVEGMGREELADALRNKFSDEVAGYRYWDVLGAAQLNRSRSWGFYESMDGQAVERVSWFAVGDERTCFCAGTPVAVPAGEKRIEDVRLRDQVLTPNGPRRVVAGAIRSRGGRFVAIVAGGRTAVATADHLYIVGGRDVCAENVMPGDCLNSVNDEPLRVDAVVQFALADAHYGPSVGGKVGVPVSVLVGIMMPVGSIYLDCNTQCGKSEIDGPSSDASLLNEGHACCSKSDAYGCLQHVLSLKPSVAGEGAELPVVVAWLRAELDSACLAGNDSWWTTAFLGAEPVVITLGGEDLAAPFTLAVEGGRKSACARADGISTGDASFDGECLATNRTDFFNAGGFGREVAGAGAVGRRSRGGSSEHGLPAGFTGSRLADDAGSMVASVGAVPTVGLRVKDLSASLARAIHEREWLVIHDAIHRLSQQLQLTVYDLEVEDQHVFYAAGALVHNCEICGALDGTVFSVGKAVERQRKIVDEDMTPDEYKDLNPWVQTKKGEDGTEFYWKDSDGESHDLTDEFSALTPGAADDGGDLQDIGIQAPPAHGSCRCTLNPVD